MTDISTREDLKEISERFREDEPSSRSKILNSVQSVKAAPGRLQVSGNDPDAVMKVKMSKLVTLITKFKTEQNGHSKSPNS